MTETTFTLISKDGVQDAEWPDNWTEVKTLVEGELADRVRAKVSAPDNVDVVLWERGQDSGYSEYTTEWDVEFKVLVGDVEVFSDFLGWSNTLDEETGQPREASRFYSDGNGLTRLVKWLDK